MIENTCLMPLETKVAQYYYYYCYDNHNTHILNCYYVDKFYQEQLTNSKMVITRLELQLVDLERNHSEQLMELKHVLYSLYKVVIYYL